MKETELTRRDFLNLGCSLLVPADDFLKKIQEQEKAVDYGPRVEIFSSDSLRRQSSHQEKVVQTPEKADLDVHLTFDYGRRNSHISFPVFGRQINNAMVYVNREGQEEQLQLGKRQFCYIPDFPIRNAESSIDCQFPDKYHLWAVEINYGHISRGRISIEAWFVNSDGSLPCPDLFETKRA